MTPRPAVFELVVTDMAAALAFYRDLGLEIPGSADAEPHVDVALPGGLRLAFDTAATIATFDPGFVPAPPHGAALAFECADAAEVDSVHDRMVQAGHRSHLAPFDAFWGQRYAVLHDPDGRGVDLFASSP